MIINCLNAWNRNCCFTTMFLFMFVLFFELNMKVLMTEILLAVWLRIFFLFFSKRNISLMNEISKEYKVESTPDKGCPDHRIKIEPIKIRNKWDELKMKEYFILWGGLKITSWFYFGSCTSLGKKNERIQWPTKNQAHKRKPNKKGAPTMHDRTYRWNNL